MGDWSKMAEEDVELTSSHKYIKKKKITSTCGTSLREYLHKACRKSYTTKTIRKISMQLDRTKGKGKDNSGQNLHHGKEVWERKASLTLGTFLTDWRSAGTDREFQSRREKCGSWPWAPQCRERQTQTISGMLPHIPLKSVPVGVGSDWVLRV